jgi:Interleukin-like EMT inducer
MVFNMSFCPVLQTPGNPRGVTLLTVDPLSCTVRRSQYYDTYASPTNANALAAALRTAVIGTLFVAVTADEPQRLIYPANSTLLTTCNVNTTNLQYRGNFAFVCVIGRPTITKWQIKSQLQLPGSIVAAAVTGESFDGTKKRNLRYLSVSLLCIYCKETV